jgi:hypothetical protein
MEPRDSDQGKIALKFANALVSGDYETAHKMLSAALREKLSLSKLQETYEAMIEYGNSPPDFIDVMNILDNWSSKQNEDIGWAYVAISGDGYGEAVSVVVSQEDEKNLIRDIEWGRP